MTVKNKALGIALAIRRAKSHSVYEPKKILETEGYFYEAEIDYPTYHTFTMNNQSGEILRGVYYADSKKCHTFLERHQVVEDIYSTTEHECLHASIFQCQEWEFDELDKGDLLDKDMIRLDERQEHNIIRIMLWEDEYFSSD